MEDGGALVPHNLALCPCWSVVCKTSPFEKREEILKVDAPCTAGMRRLLRSPAHKLDDMLLPAEADEEKIQKRGHDSW